LERKHVPLDLETYSNVTGGNAFFKAISHPLAAEKAHLLLETFKQGGDVAIYDPLGQAASFDQIYSLASLPVADYFIQDIDRHGQSFGGHTASLVTELKRTKARQLFVAAFDAGKRISAICRWSISPRISCSSATAADITRG